MLTIQLTDNLESFVRDAVSTGRYADANEVVSDALTRLRSVMDADAAASPDRSESGEPAKKLTKREFHTHLVKIGLLDQIPETSAGADNSDELIDEAGEIVDEVVIRERLIEWLTGFLDG
jgi:putative addiction module CopG family antidote